jgi:murein DD-endopeptidase MepM/ murein hydrolase activator NlpD
MSAAIAALALSAPGVAYGMTDIGAVEPPVPVRVFPINGPHDLGRSPTNGFGGGRGHTGQDMFAECGTPVVASQGGRARKADYDGAGGNFIVLTEKHTGLDAVYMHLAHRPRLHAGEAVETGRRIGSVGDTGDADGCHLHFELWTAPGWFAGGEPFDPLPRLQRWDARARTGR